MSPTNTREISAADVRDYMAAREFAACDDQGLAKARALAARLIPAELASLETIRAVHAATQGSCVYIKVEAGLTTGFLAFFGLSPAGDEAMDAGAFDTRQVRPEWVSPPSARLASAYVWGFAGETRAACFSVIRTGRDVRDRLFPGLRVFARAATVDGRKVMEPLGYRPVSPADPSLYFSPPHSLTNVRGRA